MKYKIKKREKRVWKIGDIRIRKRFALFPTSIGDEGRWLETVYIKEKLIQEAYLKDDEFFGPYWEPESLWEPLEFCEPTESAIKLTIGENFSENFETIVACAFLVFLVMTGIISFLGLSIKLLQGGL